MRRKGFTLIELLVVIAIIAVLVTLLLPNLQHARRLARKAACMANLNGIGKAIVLYDESFGGYPVFDDSWDYTNAEADMNETTMSDDPDDSDATPTDTDWAALGENAAQNWWLLIMKGLIVESGFRCPADDTDSRNDVATRENVDLLKYGWNDPDNVSYGMQWPYGAAADDDPNDDVDPAVNPAAFSDSLDGGVVTFADQNPGGPVGAEDGEFKPSNHEVLGTSYLVASGTVGFSATKDGSTCGKDGDDIYTVQDASGDNKDSITDNELPANKYDTYICRSEQ